MWLLLSLPHKNYNRGLKMQTILVKKKDYLQKNINSAIINSNTHTPQKSEEVARQVELEIRRNALALAVSIAKKWDIEACESCGKKSF